MLISKEGEDYVRGDDGGGAQQHLCTIPNEEARKERIKKRAAAVLRSSGGYTRRELRAAHFSVCWAHCCQVVWPLVFVLVTAVFSCYFAFRPLSVASGVTFALFNNDTTYCNLNETGVWKMTPRHSSFEEMSRTLVKMLPVIVAVVIWLCEKCCLSCFHGCYELEERLISEDCIEGGLLGLALRGLGTCFSWHLKCYERCFSRRATFCCWKECDFCCVWRTTKEEYLASDPRTFAKAIRYASRPVTSRDSEVSQEEETFPLEYKVVEEREVEECEGEGEERKEEREEEEEEGEVVILKSEREVEDKLERGDEYIAGAQWGLCWYNVISLIMAGAWIVIILIPIVYTIFLVVYAYSVCGEADTPAAAIAVVTTT